MRDEDLVRAYVVSIFILTFLDEYGKLERLGAFAKVHNTISLKNGNFQDQLNDLGTGKKKKVSRKAKLFAMAVSYSQMAWDMAIAMTEKISISAGTSVSCLFNHNKHLIKEIYGLNDDEFFRIGRLSQAGVTLGSCKMAKALTDCTISTINQQFNGSKG